MIVRISPSWGLGRYALVSVIPCLAFLGVYVGLCGFECRGCLTKSAVSEIYKGGCVSWLSAVGFSV